MHGWAKGPPPEGAVGRQVQSAPYRYVTLYTSAFLSLRLLLDAA